MKRNVVFEGDVSCACASLKGRGNKPKTQKAFSLARRAEALYSAPGARQKVCTFLDAAKQCGLIGPVIHKTPEGKQAEIRAVRVSCAHVNCRKMRPAVNSSSTGASSLGDQAKTESCVPLTHQTRGYSVPPVGIHDAPRAVTPETEQTALGRRFRGHRETLTALGSATRARRKPRTALTVKHGVATLRRRQSVSRTKQCKSA